MHSWIVLQEAAYEHRRDLLGTADRWRLAHQGATRHTRRWVGLRPRGRSAGVRSNSGACQPVTYTC
ncbi:MAG: hypothetical protein ACRDYY_01035 [Acidimicrobiales bacterium]